MCNYRSLSESRRKISKLWNEVEEKLRKNNASSKISFFDFETSVIYSRFVTLPPDLEFLVVKNEQ